MGMRMGMMARVEMGKMARVEVVAVAARRSVGAVDPRGWG
jgi:hypothetical protein